MQKNKSLLMFLSGTFSELSASARQITLLFISMKFLHEMMPIFRTKFSYILRRGLGHTYKTGLNFRHLCIHLAFKTQPDLSFQLL
jgi:hypothetical protein